MSGMSDSTKRWLTRAIAISGPALLAALKEIYSVQPGWTWLGLVTPLLGAILAEYIPAPKQVSP